MRLSACRVLFATSITHMLPLLRLYIVTLWMCACLARSVLLCVLCFCLQSIDVAASGGGLLVTNLVGVCRSRGD